VISFAPKHNRSKLDGTFSLLATSAINLNLKSYFTVIKNVLSDVISKNAAGTLYAKSGKLCPAGIFTHPTKFLACIILYHLRHFQSKVTDLE